MIRRLIDPCTATALFFFLVCATLTTTATAQENPSAESARMTVRFQGMAGVHIQVYLADGINGTVSGNWIKQSRWNNHSAQFSLPPGVYDLVVRKGAAIQVVDNVDCRVAQCLADRITAKLSVIFPGMSGVHIAVMFAGTESPTIPGRKLLHSRWNTDRSDITVFRQIYDVHLQKGKSEYRVETVDCRSGACAIDGVTADMQIEFSGLSRVNVLVTEADGLKGQASGKLLAQIRSQYNRASLAVFAAVYDIALTRGPDVFFVDGVDCSLGSCVVNEITARLGIEFPGLTGVDAELMVPDGVPGQVSGELVDRSYQRNHAAQIMAFRKRYDVRIRHSETSIFDDVDCSPGSCTVAVGQDLAGPQISIGSHADNDGVPVTGFLLSGKISDPNGVASLTATLDDPVLGRTVSAQPAGIGDDDTWSVLFVNGSMTEGEQITITLQAADLVGNRSTVGLKLTVENGFSAVAQAINRMTFGTSPKLLERVTAIGSTAYLNEQLNPDGIDDSEFEQLIAGKSAVTNAEELQTWTLLHMIHSRKQLLEVMTWFWDNHFSTDLNAKRNNPEGIEIANSVAFEWAENRAFRAHALGNFRDLLGISAKSPSMLIYLDNISNVVNDSNENYAREVLELHSMGLRGGYSEADIEASAEIFTGWHLNNGQFFFNAQLHNAAQQKILGTTVPAGGLEQGEMLLDIIARRSATASFICAKLIALLVNDDPPQSLLNRCAGTFLANSEEPDQIAAVLRLILESPDFHDPANYRNKIKNPLEFVVGAVRNLEADTTAKDLIGPLAAMGIRLYENPIPTGWPEFGEDWINSASMIERIKWINKMVRKPAGGSATSVNPVPFFLDRGYYTGREVLGFLLEIGLNSDFTPLGYRQAAHILRAQEFDFDEPDTEIRLRELTGAVFSFPQYQFH